jgi:hypothetical protein
LPACLPAVAQVCGGRGTWDPVHGACRCVSPWSGRFCDDEGCPASSRASRLSPSIATTSGVVDVDDSRCSGGRGVCVAGRCFCSPGFFGRSCAHAHCPNKCSGRGACVSQLSALPAEFGRLVGPAFKFKAVAEEVDGHALLHSNNSSNSSNSNSSSSTSSHVGEQWYFEGCVCDEGFAGVECEFEVEADGSLQRVAPRAAP